MRYSAPVLAALVASVSATAPIGRAVKMLTLETSPGVTIEVTEEQKFEMMDRGAHFFDITEFQDKEVSANRLAVAAALPFPDKFHQKCTIDELTPKLDMERIERLLTKFSSFHNRYYLSNWGVQAVDWLHDQIKEAIDESGIPFVNLRYVRHVAWAQPSLIVTIPGRNQRTVILGSHLDSVISGDRGTGRAPGADDNGSGSLMNLEVLRAVLSDKRVQDGDILNTLEFHWYGAEEAGLLGSQDIFTQYRTLNRQVVSMLNQDMVGYGGRDGVERFGLVTDFTDADQNEFLKKAIGQFTNIPYEETVCGYACSDHASANRNGFPSSFIFEAPFGNHNPYIHTPNDTMEHVSFEHVNEHAKMALAYMYELAYWPFA
ncbi:hypothetical protein ACHAQH_009612 [Verticillium albo-atrum]